MLFVLRDDIQLNLSSCSSSVLNGAIKLFGEIPVGEIVTYHPWGGKEANLDNFQLIMSAIFSAIGSLSYLL